MSIQQAFENFVSDDGGKTFKESVMASTVAGWDGGWYSVELFDDSTFRVLWNHHIGKLYRSPGIILEIPQYSDEALEYMDGVASEEDPEIRWWLDEIAELMRDDLSYCLDEMHS